MSHEPHEHWIIKIIFKQTHDLKKEWNTKYLQKSEIQKFSECAFV